MKYFIFFMMIAYSVTGIFAQSDSLNAIEQDSISTMDPDSTTTINVDSIITINTDIKPINRDSIATKTSVLIADLLALKISEINSNRYKLYPTKNMYNFLKLDTRTGRIEQVQWSLESETEFSIYLNEEDLSWSLNVMNSFELYPTDNIYQFILLDKATGRAWHVQWGMSSDNRWIRRIY